MRPGESLQVPANQRRRSQTWSDLHHLVTMSAVTITSSLVHIVLSNSKGENEILSVQNHITSCGRRGHQIYALLKSWH